MSIYVIRFDSEVNGEAYMTAFWSVWGEDGKTALLNRKSTLRVEPLSSGTQGRVEAQNRVLTDFSREIAATVESLKP